MSCTTGGALRLRDPPGGLGHQAAPLEILKALGFFVGLPREPRPPLRGPARRAQHLCEAAEDAGTRGTSAPSRTESAAADRRDPVGRLPPGPAACAAPTSARRPLLVTGAWPDHFGAPLVRWNTPFQYRRPRSPPRLPTCGASWRRGLPSPSGGTRTLDERRFLESGRPSQAASELWAEVLNGPGTGPPPSPPSNAFIHLGPVVDLRRRPAHRRLTTPVAGQPRSAHRAGEGPGPRRALPGVWATFPSYPGSAPLQVLAAARGEQSSPPPTPPWGRWPRSWTPGPFTSMAPVCL